MEGKGDRGRERGSQRKEREGGSKEGRDTYHERIYAYQKVDGKCLEGRAYVFFSLPYIQDIGQCYNIFIPNKHVLY